MGKRLKAVSSSIKRELAVYGLLLKDERTPKAARVLLWLAVGYLLMPFDLIPDWIPVLGQLDDLVVVPLLVYLALRLIPGELVNECRSRVASETPGAEAAQ